MQPASQPTHNPVHAVVPCVHASVIELSHFLFPAAAAAAVHFLCIKQQQQHAKILNTGRERARVTSHYYVVKMQFLAKRERGRTANKGDRIKLLLN